MGGNEPRAKAIMAGIREILVADWDPINVMDDPEWPRDEYDRYAAEIYSFLVRGESAEFIAGHLFFVEEALMGLGASPLSERLNVAQKLKALDVSM